MPPYNNRGAYRQSGQRSQPYYDAESYGSYRSGGRPQRQQRKHSGAKFRASDKNGNPVTTGWNKSRGAGFVKFLCVVTSASKSGTSGTGKPWVSVMVVIEKQMCAPQKVSGMMNPQTGKVTVQALGIVINPQAPNGGYCGRYGKRR